MAAAMIVGLAIDRCLDGGGLDGAGLGVGELGAGVGLLRPGDAFSSNGRSSSSGGGRHGGSLRRQP